MGLAEQCEILAAVELKTEERAEMTGTALTNFVNPG
jgi:hypothetical protein